MEMKSLKFYAELAHQILNSETQYISNKKIISELFGQRPSGDFKSIVKRRITVIDSYYSTQMSKRLYGIDELAEAISKYTDDVLKYETTKFLKNPKGDTVINLLFSKHYGIDKAGKSFGKSISLISKYLYFLNDFEFPIYDSLAVDSHKLLRKNKIICAGSGINEQNYFPYMIELNTKSNINNHEKLDNLLWLIGKLIKGSFSILMTKEKYKQLINGLVPKLKHLSSEEKDDLIRVYIKDIYQGSDNFKETQKEFFEFVFSLEK